jgi:hypothetical protein
MREPNRGSNAALAHPSRGHPSCSSISSTHASNEARRMRASMTLAAAAEHATNNHDAPIGEEQRIVAGSLRVRADVATNSGAR